MSLLSVVTITFNNFDELLSTISSLSQVPDIQHVVVNGGRCKKTLDFLETYASKSLSEPDRGISDAFNKGFKLADGEFVTYLNSGDLLLDKTYYYEALSFLNENPGFDFIYADLCVVDKFAGEIHVRSNYLLPNMPYLHPTLIVKRKIFEQVGLFDESFRVAMDLDFVYRLQKQGAKGHYFPRMVVKMDGAGVSSSNFKLTYFESVKAICKNSDYSFRSLVYILRNGFLLLVKVLLLKMGGAKLLGLYRKMKFKFKS